VPVNPATFRVGVLHGSDDTSIRGCMEALSQIRRVITSFIYISARVGVVISLRATNRRLRSCQRTPWKYGRGTVPTSDGSGRSELLRRTSGATEGQPAGAHRPGGFSAGSVSHAREREGGNPSTRGSQPSPQEAARVSGILGIPVASQKPA